MIAEIHCHSSEHSPCSQVSAADLIRKAAQIGLQALILTDHHYCWTGEELNEVRNRAGVTETFVLLSGQEISTADFGDVLLFGPGQTVERQEITLPQLRARFPEAAIVWAHPYRYKSNPPAERLVSDLIDAVEIFNSNHTISRNIQALQDWHTYKFTATGGTDTHGLGITGSYPTIFDHPFQTLEEFVEEIRSGRCRPFFKEIPRSGTSRTRVNEVTIGPRQAGSRSAVIVKTFADTDSWKAGERSFRLVEELTRCGFVSGTFRVPKPLARDSENLSLVEERIKGRTLHDVLIDEDREAARRYLRLAAQWLAYLHNLDLHITPIDEHLRAEPSRLHWYMRHLFFRKHPDRNRVEEIREYVWDLEKRLITNFPERLTQGHGDFHLKNIYIAVDAGSGAEYVCPIDFHSSYQLPRAFDVGTFAAQHLNMYDNRPDVAQKAPIDVFLDDYMRHARGLEEDFIPQVALFKARACLSILYYLSKVGKHDGENFRRIMIEAETSLVAAQSMRLTRGSPVGSS